jgi:hypothetical protein
MPHNAKLGPVQFQPPQRHHAFGRQQVPKLKALSVSAWTARSMRPA